MSFFSVPCSPKFAQNDLSTFSGIAAQGIVDTVISPGNEWVIRCNGVYWRAQSRSRLTVSPGQAIKIVAREQLKLLIEPM